MGDASRATHCLVTELPARSVRLVRGDTTVRAMPYQQDRDRNNDIRFLTPLLLMAAILAAGILVYSYAGHALAAGPGGTPFG
jgi:hypothetical protein